MKRTPPHSHDFFDVGGGGPRIFRGPVADCQWLDLKHYFGIQIGTPAQALILITPHP